MTNCFVLLIFASVLIIRMKSVDSIVKNCVENVPSGQVFDYSLFPLRNESFMALAKSLCRLSKQGQIVRLSRGKYYKPRESVFGVLMPDESQLIRSFTQLGDKTIGYVTGLAAFNSLGLTSQVSNTIMIARGSNQPMKDIFGFKVRFVKRNFRFTRDDVKLLQILDALKDIKKIPDTTVSESLKILITNLEKLKADELQQMIRLAQRYPPSTRALVGAIIENRFSEIRVVSLYKSLNPLTKYLVGIDPDILPNKLKWNIS
ncbi:MAG: DUF6088 family protein [Bacteroidota bacterium]